MVEILLLFSLRSCRRRISFRFSFAWPRTPEPQPCALSPHNAAALCRANSTSLSGSQDVLQYAEVRGAWFLSLAAYASDSI